MRKLLLLAAAAAALTVAVAIMAQEPAARTSDGTSSTTASSAHERVPVPEPSEKAVSYYRTGNYLWIFDNFWGLLVPLVLLFSGFSSRMRSLAQRIGRKWFFTVAIYAVFLTAITFVIDLPIAWYEGFVREHAYGLSSQTAGKWWADTGKSLALGLIFNAALLWIPYLLLRKSPKRWWLYTGIASIPLVLVLLLITPIWIEPMFNKFGPMKDKALEQRILHLASRAGISKGRVYEVEKSVDTKTVNAYVNGLGGTQRIVLWDTLVKKLDGDQVLFVMGHEMGHYVLGHVTKLIFLLCGLIFIGLYAVHRTAHLLTDRYGDRFGFHELGDVASAPLMGLLFGVTLFVLSPAILAYTRHTEHEADRFGLEITQNNYAAASSFAKLQTENLAVPRPGPLYKFFRESHPALGERIDFANDYHPWDQGQPLQYGMLFKNDQ